MDKKNLKTRIMRASGKGCVAAVFAERSSMACVPAFMESCEAAGIKPAAGVRMMVEAAGVRGELLFLVKDRAGYREICHLLSDTLAKDDPVVTMEMIGQGHVIIVHEKNGLFDKILMRNKEIKKEIRELKRKMKGLPSAGGESWKDAVGEYNRLQEEDAVVRMSLKQVPASDSYQLDFLNKKAKEIESRKRKAKDILSGIENGIKEREKLTVLLETKNSMLEEDVTVLFREAYDALSVYGDIYIETDEKGRALCQIAESDSLPCIREIRETDGIKYIPGTAADVLDIIDQCSFRYEPEDWTVGRSAEKEIKTGIARLKAGGCTWTSLYDTRLEAEIEMLRKTDTEGYFLTVCDILRLAEEYYPSDPFYPGLLVSYVLGITDIDPVCNDILTKLSEETFVAGIHHPRFMIRSELSASLYKKIREKYAVSRISKDTIVIGYPDIRDYVPVCRDRIQCDRDEAEKMGLFCMDLEEQEYLSIFKECISSIQDPGIPIDPEVFKNVIAKGHLNFICGCEGMEIQKQIRQSHPESMRELVSFFSSTCEKAEAFYRALFVYRSAYLKYRFPLNYISAYISHFPDKMRSIKYDAVCKDLVFLDPDINVSEADCFVERDSIRLGLKSTGVSGKTVENILQERREGFFLSADDLMNRVKLSDREAECLNDAGVFQNIGGPVSDRSVPVVEDPPEEPDKDLIPMEGVVLKTEEKISKDGSMIASVRMGTSSGEVYAMFFAKAYEKYAGLLKADAELRLYGEYVQDRYGNTFSVKEAYPVSDDVYYISAKVYEEAVFYPFRRRCGCQLFLMEPSGRLVNTGCFYSSRIADVQGVRMIPKI